MISQLKQIGYKVGIDDCITKPFDLEELGFKLTAIFRRLDIIPTKEIKIKNFAMNEIYIALIDGKEI